MSSEIIQNITYDNYDDFQHVNFVFSQYFISLFWGLFNHKIDLKGKVIPKIQKHLSFQTLSYIYLDLNVTFNMVHLFSVCHGASPLGYLYRWKREIFGQTIWDKFVMHGEHTSDEHIENIIGNMWEDTRNMVGIQKIKKIYAHKPFPPRKKN
jgi:hypothetical protein